MTTQREPAFVIDPRARAMLAEMGVRVWMPADAAPSAPQAAPVNRSTAMPVQAKHVKQEGGASQPAVGAVTVAVPVRREPPLRLPVMDAPPVAALGATRYVIGNLPTETADYDLMVLGEPCQGTTASLLVNLLKPLASAAPRVFVAHMVASHNDAVNLHDQLAMIPAKLVLALGPHAAKALLDKAVDGIPFSKQRGIVHNERIIVTYHPQQLLRQSRAKAASWQDIRLALKTLRKS